MKLTLLLFILIIIGVPITVLCLFMNGRNQTEEDQIADDNAQLEALREYNKKHPK